MKYLDNNGLLYVIQKIKTWLSGKVDKVDGKGLSTNDYTTNEKNKLAGLSNYTLPTASADTKGGVKIGSGLQMNGDVLSATGGGTADAVDWENVTNKPTKLTDFTNDLAYKTAYDASTNKILTESDTEIKTLVGTTDNPVNAIDLSRGLYKVKGYFKADPQSGTTLTSEHFLMVLPDSVPGSFVQTILFGSFTNSQPGQSIEIRQVTRSESTRYKISPIDTSLKTLTDFSNTKTQLLKNSNGTFKWVDDTYPTVDEVETAITSKGYQTASDVNSIITGKGYQTANDVETAITNKISSVMTYKGTVANYSDLPTNAKVGDTYNITNKSDHNKAGDNAAWNGTSWDILAGTIDLSGYYTKAEMEALTNDEIDGIFTAE